MAFYADKDYTQDQEVLLAMQEVMQGHLTLHWYDANTERIKGKPSDYRRGLTYRDLDVGSYGYTEMPEDLRRHQSMVARGSEKWGKLPDMGYLVNRKSEVWSDNVADLYEEDKSRRWAPALDVPWTGADAPGAEVEAACAQLYTFLQECALVSLDFPARWVSLVNQEFLEVKSFMCAQMLDWARLLEAFRKRALMGGQGLKRASATAEQGLKEWLWAETYPQGSLSINLSLAGLLLAVFRQVAAFAPRKADRVLMGFAMQDAARQTAYGFGALRYLLSHRPAQKVVMDEYLDQTEHVMVALFGSPELLEPMIVICGGGLDPAQIGAGRIATAKFIRIVVREYLERLEAAGLTNRSTRSRLPAVVDRIATS